MIQIVFELSLIDKVIALSAKSLKLSGFVDLAESTLKVILRHSKMVVDWAR
jgi:hypothetical protein